MRRITFKVGEGGGNKLKQAKWEITLVNKLKLSFKTLTLFIRKFNNVLCVIVAMRLIYEECPYTSTHISYYQNNHNRILIYKDENIHK